MRIRGGAGGNRRGQYGLEVGRLSVKQLRKYGRFESFYCQGSQVKEEKRNKHKAEAGGKRGG